MKTIDSILAEMRGWVENDTPMSPGHWVNASASLNILISDEHNKLFELQQEVAKVKADLITNGYTVARAKVVSEASDAYKEAQKQRAKIEMIQEAIRISKVRARLTDDEIKNY